MTDSKAAARATQEPTESGISPKSNINDPNELPYNPYEHRTTEHPNGFVGAFIHVVKTSLGTGILAIPRAFKSAGLLVGFFGTIVVGIICTYAIHILVKSSLKICRKLRTPCLGYADTAELAFKCGPPRFQKYSQFARYFVDGSLFSIHFLVDAIYIVFIAISLTKLFSAYYPEVTNWGDYIFKLAILVPLLLCSQVRELKHLVPFSFIANMMLFITFGTTGYHMFSGLGDIDIRDRNLATSLSGIPSFFSTVLFSIEGIGAIMPIENSMVTSNFIGCPSVLNSAMAVIIIIYATMGFFGYYKFGEATAATITSNLPTNDIAGEIAQVAIATSVFFSFMLVFYVPVDIVWSRIKHRIPNDKWNIGQIILRSSLVILCMGVAIAGGERLGLLIDLVGAIFLSLLGLFVPALIETIIEWEDEDRWGPCYWILVKNIILMTLSVFALVSGVYYAIMDAFDTSPQAEPGRTFGRLLILY